MADYEECACGQMIRMRTWHGRLQWVHVRSGTPWCTVQRATPKPHEDD